MNKTYGFTDECEYKYSKKYLKHLVNHLVLYLWLH